MAMVNAQPDKLLTFNEKMLKTPVMLEGIFLENKEMIANTLHYINAVREMLNKKKREAQIRLDHAEASLLAAIATNAKSEEKVNLAPYRERVREAKHRLEEITIACDKARAAMNDYSKYTEQYFRDEKKHFEEYFPILKMGSERIARYAELVNRSTMVIPER